MNNDDLEGIGSREMGIILEGIKKIMANLDIND
jgi:hypothetical protein